MAHLQERGDPRWALVVEGEGEPDGDQPPSRGCPDRGSVDLRLRRTAAALVGLLGAACAAALLAALAGRGPPPGRAAAAAALRGVVARFDPLSSAASGLRGMPAGEDMDSSYLDVAPVSLPPSFTNAYATGGQAGSVAATTTTLAGAAAGLEYDPTTATCADNEELHLGLCYKKCSLLTNGTFPFRSSPFNCCKQSFILSCAMASETDFKLSMPGGGYTVDGRGGIPHPPGACDTDEENFEGRCYKKCKLLTNGEYPYRSAAYTCCKAKPCWNIFNLKTNGLGGANGCSGFGVAGDAHPDFCPHAPHSVTTSS